MGKGKTKRLETYHAAIAKMKELDISLGCAMSLLKHGYGLPWSDSSSPTGMSQKCCYEAYGTCQYPCNGDC